MIQTLSKTHIRSQLTISRPSSAHMAVQVLNVACGLCAISYRITITDTRKHFWAEGACRLCTKTDKLTSTHT